MPLKFKYSKGCLSIVKPVVSSQKFPPSIVEPDDSYTIRQIYDNWRKGKPTSPHLFPTEFDEEGNGFDDSESSDDFRENPIDICQVHNERNDAIEDFETEKAYIAKTKKQKTKQTEPPKIEDTSKQESGQ